MFTNTLFVKNGEADIAYQILTIEEYTKGKSPKRYKKLLPLNTPAPSYFSPEILMEIIVPPQTPLPPNPIHAKIVASGIGLTRFNGEYIEISEHRRVDTSKTVLVLSNKQNEHPLSKGEVRGIFKTDDGSEEVTIKFS